MGNQLIDVGREGGVQGGDRESVDLLRVEVEQTKGYSVHCKKRFAVFQSPAGMSPTKLSMAGNN